MQSYLHAQESRRSGQASKPHSSSVSFTAYDTPGTIYTTSPNPDDMAASAVAVAEAVVAKQYPGMGASGMYTTPKPPRDGGAPSRFRGVSPTASYTSTGKAQISASTASASGQLVQIKPNVWLPLDVVQEAGGDINLALHLAAQTRTSSCTQEGIDISPTAGKARTPGTNPRPSLDDSFLPRQGKGQSENDSNRAAVFERNAKYAPWTHSNQHADSDSITAGSNHSLQYDSSKMQSHFSSAVRLKSDSMVNSNNDRSKFDPTIQPPSFHMNPAQFVGGAQTASQTAASTHSLDYGFRSPKLSLPMLGSTGSNNSAYVSPQCMMDSNSLFSYSIATPEQTVHSRPAPWFATPDTNPTQTLGGPHSHNPTPFNPAAHYPELNPSATHLHMGHAYDLGLGNYSSMHDSPGGAGAYLGNPWQNPHDNPVMSQYAASHESQAVQSNMAAGMGSHTNTDSGQLHCCPPLHDLPAGLYLRIRSAHVALTEHRPLLTVRSASFSDCCNGLHDLPAGRRLCIQGHDQHMWLLVYNSPAYCQVCKLFLLLQWAARLYGVCIYPSVRVILWGVGSADLKRLCCRHNFPTLDPRQSPSAGERLCLTGQTFVAIGNFSNLSTCRDCKQ